MQPLVNDLNALLDHRERGSWSARIAKAGDLAHGLKTPLAVLARRRSALTAAGQYEARRDDRRSRSSGCAGRSTITSRTRGPRRSGAAIGAGARSLASAEGLARTLARLHAEQGSPIAVDVRRRTCVRVQREDLDEMLGNLLDNACKWARSRVSVDRRTRTGRVVILVDDDGPGLPTELREKVLQRGVRADEAAPGRASASPSCATWPSFTRGPFPSRPPLWAASGRASPCLRARHHRGLEKLRQRWRLPLGGEQRRSGFGRFQNGICPWRRETGARSLLETRAMIDARQELRVALRRLRKSAGTSALVVITLGSVLGANTLAFSFVNEILLNPLPAVSNKTGLVNVHRWQNDKDGVQGFSYPAFRALAQADVFEKGLVGFNGRGLSLERTSSPELVFGMLVSENYFDALGVRPARGRAFGLEDNRKGSAGVVVLSDALWRTRFGGDPESSAPEVRLNGQSFTVIGVGPARFSGHFVGFAADLWIPLSWGPVMSGQSDLMENPAAEWLEVFGRLRTGSSDAAAAALTRIQATLPRGEGGEHAPERVLVEPLTGIDRDLRGPVAAFLVLLQAATILVVVIALLNVSTLLLARSIARGQETAVRLALGASRGNLLAPFALESMVLCGLGGFVGLLLSVLGARVAPQWLPPFAIPIRFDLALDGRTFAFSSLVAVLGDRHGHAGPCSLRRAQRAAGGAPRGRAATHRAITMAGRPRRRSGRLRHRGSGERFRVRALPGPIRGGDARLRYRPSADHAPRTRRFWARTPNPDAPFRRGPSRPWPRSPESNEWASRGSSPYGIGTSTLQARRGSSGPGDPWFRADWNAVSPGFFETLGVHAARGRTFSEFDRAKGPRVVVINETLAQRIFPRGEALGEALAVGEKGEMATVIGIVPDLSLRRLGEAPRSATLPAVRAGSVSEGLDPRAFGASGRTRFLDPPGAGPGRA